MKCPACQHESPAGTKFCGECGARLLGICPSCGMASPATHARHRGNAPERDTALREALRLYQEMGATGHAERLARELGA